MHSLSPDAIGHAGGMMLLGVLIALSWLLSKTYDPAARAWLLAGVHRSASSTLWPECLGAVPIKTESKVLRVIASLDWPSGTL